jgi:hypothetical protein
VAQRSVTAPPDGETRSQLATEVAGNSETAHHARQLARSLATRMLPGLMSR